MFVQGNINIVYINVIFGNKNGGRLAHSVWWLGYRIDDQVIKVFVIDL